MQVVRIKSQWPEEENFSLFRADTGEEYIYIHFLTPVELVLEGNRVRVEPGACILYNQHARQEFAARETPLLHDWFHVTGDLDPLMKKYELDYGCVYMPGQSFRLTRLIQDMELECLRGDPMAQRVCELKIEELFIAMARSCQAPERQCRLDRAVQKQLMALRLKVHHDFTHPWTVEEMAALACLSPSHFYAVYRRLFGISPKQDLLQVRLEHAKTLLSQGKYTVKQVAHMAGFSGEYHFIRRFKQEVGVTPGQYAGC